LEELIFNPPAWGLKIHVCITSPYPVSKMVPFYGQVNSKSTSPPFPLSQVNKKEHGEI
jgi:hypothetical protein